MFKIMIPYIIQFISLYVCLYACIVCVVCMYVGRDVVWKSVRARRPGSAELYICCKKVSSVFGRKAECLNSQELNNDISN